MSKFSENPQSVDFMPRTLDKVAKRFSSEDSRLNDSEKIVELYDLRDFGFNKRTEIFQWELVSFGESEFYTKYEMP